MSTFGQRVHSLRISKGLSLRELSKLVNISPSAIHAYEIGKRDAGYKSLEALSNVFDCDIDYLLCRSDVKRSIPENETTDERHARWLSEFEKMSEFGQNLLIESIKKLESIPPEQREMFLRMFNAALSAQAQPKEDPTK